MKDAMQALVVLVCLVVGSVILIALSPLIVVAIMVIERKRLSDALGDFWGGFLHSL